LKILLIGIFWFVVLLLKTLLSLCFTFVAMTAFAQLNAAQPDASTALHIESVNSGVQSQNDSAQINAIASPATGLLAYSRDQRQIAMTGGQTMYNLINKSETDQVASEAESIF
jgi:hypothetical protein